MKRLLTILSVAAALVWATPAAASSSVHPDIESMLADVPGGVVIDDHTAYWSALDMTMNVPVGRAVGACATGRICAYSATTLAGASLSWTTCATHAIPGSFVAKSLANARTDASVAQARNGTTVVTSAAASAWVNIFAAVDNVRCLS